MRPTALLPFALCLLSIRVAPAASQERALAPLEVRPSPAFLAAVEDGTRTLTGELRNPDEVYPPAILERIARAGGDEVVPVVTEADFGAGRATRGRDGETSGTTGP